MSVSVGFRIAGIEAFMAVLRGLEKAVSDLDDAWAGSAVQYGPYHEWGTSSLAAREHWRVAIAELITEVTSDSVLNDQIFEAVARNGSPLEVAIMVERRVKEIITAKGIIDTGNYRGSVTSGKSEDEVFAKSAGLAINPDTVAEEL